MCGKLITVISLLALCTAEQPEHAPSSHQAVSSQSYNRGDVPLSYKFNAIHIYTTPKPGQYKDHVPQHHYQERNHDSYYQYAPIQNPKPQELYTKVAAETSAAESYHGNTANEGQVSYHGNAAKSQQEPKQPQEHTHYHPNAYVPGKNVHVLPSVAKRPEYSAWYRPHKIAVPEKLNDSVTQNHHQLYQTMHHFLPSTEKTTYYNSYVAPEPQKSIVFAVVPKQYQQHPYLYKQQAETANEAPSNQRPPMIFFNVAKTKAYTYPHSAQKSSFPHYQDVEQLQYQVNEAMSSVPVNYVYVQKPHNYYVSETEH